MNVNNDRAAGLLGVVLYRTSEAQRLRALAAALHTRNRALAADLLIAARDLEARQPARITVIEAPQRAARHS